MCNCRVHARITEATIDRRTAPCPASRRNSARIPANAEAHSVSTAQRIMTTPVGKPEITCIPVIMDLPDNLQPDNRSNSSPRPCAMLRSSHSDEPGLNLEVICLCGHGGSPWKKSRNIPGLKLPRPRRDNARHPGLRNELAHVLVVMNDDSQKDVVHGGVGIEEFRFPLEIRRCFGG